MQLSTQIKAEALKTGLEMITGYAPVITERPDGSAYLVFKKEDLPGIRSKLTEMALKAGKTPGDVAVSLSPVIVPLALKWALPVLLGLVAVGFAAGWLIKGGK